MDLNFNISPEYEVLFSTICQTVLENIEAFEAMFNSRPVTHNNSNYGCISAITLRQRSHISGKLDKPIIQLELMSKNRGCAVIAAPKDVKVIKLCP